MKRIIAVLLAVALVFAFAACGKTDGGDKPAAEKLRFVTGGESGTYYGFGSVIAQHASSEAGVNVVAITSGGSQANINELQDGNAEIGFCQTDVMTYAYNGTNLFAETGKVDCITAVATLYTEQVQIVTCNPDIKTVADLKGKSVSVGDAGSGTYFNAMDILGAYGLSEKDIKPTYQGFGDSADAIKNGTIDAAFVVAGAPTTAITDLSTTKPVYLVSLDDEHINALIEKSPYYAKCTISKDTYKTPADVQTVGVGAVILARKDVSEDAVYKLVKDIYESAATQTAAHAKYAELSLEYASSITSVPYHPGAAKYFAEKGITVNTAK